MNINESPNLRRYRDTMKRCIRMYYPNIPDRDMDNAIEYSINKRYKAEPAKLINSYMHKEGNATLLYLADYIAKREPIITPYGTMFKHHCDEPNPMAYVIDSFLTLRSKHKKEMFKYPKGSENFEKFNLLQSLDKIDCNGIYG